MIVNRRSLILYFIRTSGLKPEKLKEKILNPEVRKEIMTTAEMLIHEGMEKGAYQKACQTARAMLKKDMDQHIIAEVTDLTLEDIERLAKEI
jgi:predicted transposase/invertase (TIGR01784 family)